MKKIPQFVCYLFLFIAVHALSRNENGFAEDQSIKLFEKYCFDCHSEDTKEGGLDLDGLLVKSKIGRAEFDGKIVFENLITGKMPPSDAEQPSEKERLQLLNWLAKNQPPRTHNSFRRISRHEFDHSTNDMLGIQYELAKSISDDRGTTSFDSDRRILLTKEMLSAYFSVVDQKLEFAFPSKGFLPLKTWRTNKLRDSHPTYKMYIRRHQEGMLFSWTRANNGNSYSFFYDHFEPPIGGWYEFTFDAAKVGEFAEDISLQVHAGKYYYADDRPQPQRLLDVISLGDKRLKSYTIRGFLNPGESVSVHCFSRHTWRKTNTTEGAYIKQLTIRGPIYDWPPRPFLQVFAGHKLDVPSRRKVLEIPADSVLREIGGSISVSSFQKGMEKEQMLDDLSETFWHTQFTPSLAKPPHFVILQNPKEVEISGLQYATWSGGNGNGQVTAYEIYLSDDGKRWGDPIKKGELEKGLSNKQPINFDKSTKKKFIKFLITNSFSIDGRSLASIGKLDVVAFEPKRHIADKIKIVSPTVNSLKQVIRKFAYRAFGSRLTEQELAPYYQAGLKSYENDSDFEQAVKLGLKSILCSHRFLFASESQKNKSHRVARDLARTLWLSVPDDRLLDLAEENKLSEVNIRNEIDRMLDDRKSARMIHSLCNQWLNLRSFRKVSPSLKLYPLYDDLLEFYLPRETELFLRHLITQNHPVTHLIDSEFSFLNQRLAQHYGIENVIGQKMRNVTFPKGSPRGGLLTMGSILKVTTDGFDTSPILRGAWISKNLAGNTLWPPPENVKAIEPETSGATTLREQIELHKTSESCASCHKSIDPYGFALENFDATGKWRSRYQIKLSHQGTFQYRREGYFKLAGNVDPTGVLDDQKFVDANGLKKILLSNHKKVAYNLMKKFFEYANGYEPTFGQRIQLFQSIPQKAEDCRMKDLVIEVLLVSFVRKQ